MKFQRMLLTRIGNSLPKKAKILLFVAHVKYLFISIISIFEIYMFTVFTHYCSMYQNCSKVTVLYDSVSRI